jgi:hypothetical protein
LVVALISVSGSFILGFDCPKTPDEKPKQSIHNTSTDTTVLFFMNGLLI